MTNSHQLQQLLRRMQSSRSTLAHDLTRDVRTTGSRSPLSMPLLKRFGVPLGIALGAMAILRKGRTRRNR
jgi:hypothetical protein